VTAKKQSKAASHASSDESVVVYVHGIGDQLPAAELKQRWDLALFGRDVGHRSVMAYWSDVLHPDNAGGPTTKQASSRRARAQATSASATSRASPLSAGQRAQMAEFQRQLSNRLGATLNPKATDRQGPRAKVLPLPASARRVVTERFFKLFVQDAADYLFDKGLRQRIRQRLRDVLTSVGDRPVTLVAHSLGSVVSYEVLQTMAASSLRLQALVTLGSPLGIQEVQDLLDPAVTTVPERVPRWNNYSDPLDPVALDMNLASDFAPSQRDIRVQDEAIVNSQTRRFWSFNPHAAVGYLAHPSVRRTVHDAMRVDSMARFVMARDVAERLGAEPEERHPVLIEVLEPGYAALGESADALKDQESQEQAKGARRAAALGRAAGVRLEDRIQETARRLRELVSDPKAARIDPLRRFVAAHLTAGELQQVGVQHQDLRVYAVWLSSRKSKLTDRRSLGAIKADAALTSFAADGSGITWAVLDTGIQSNHPHFKDCIESVYDCTEPGPPRLVHKAEDVDGHGTHVSGIIAGRSPKDKPVGPNAETDLRGIAPRTRLVVYKVLNDEGFGEDAWTIKALDHIAQQNDNISGGHAIHGVNLSLGGPFDHTVYGCGFSPICAELRRLWRNGVLVVVACGNEGQLQVQTRDGEVEINSPMSVGDPANLEECIAVGSVHADRPYLYGVSSFSSRGPTADGRAKPDVVAPGERILSCNAQWRSGERAQYRFSSGTSMAAPHVSGLLAAFLSVRREFRGRPDEVKQILLKACSDLNRDRYHQGRGLPNLMQMLLNV
jgi:pimeloyl-ACP methyl ester carboxylesterase